MPPTTDTSRTARLLALMKKRDDAFNARDFAAVDEVHHSDVIADATGRAEPIYGKEAYAAFIQQQVLRSFPDAQTTTPYPIQFGSGDWITVVTRSAGTFTGELTLPDGTVIPPTGKAFNVEFAQTTRWDGDQIIAIYAFFDAALQRRQLGLAWERAAQPLATTGSREPTGGVSIGTRTPRRPGARRLSLLSIPGTAVVTVMLAAKGPRMVTEESGREAWLRQARSYLRNADPVLARLIDDRPEFDLAEARLDNPFGLVLPTDLFGALLFQITGQQLSVPATRRTLARIGALFGGHLPSATELLGADPAKLRAAGLSWRKIGTLRDLAGRMSDGRLDPKMLSSLPDDEIMAELTAIPGIGPWTVHGALLLLGREDVVVPGDLRVRKAVQAAYRLDHLPTQQEVLAIADKWRPYRSLATSYLFTATFAQAKTPPAAPRKT